MKNLTTLSLIFVAWLLCVFGCASSNQNISVTNKPQVSELPDHAKPEYKHGSKIIAYYNSTQDKSFYYQQDIKFNPDILVNNQKTSGKHGFELSESAESAGNGRSPERITFSLLHDVASKKDWHFQPNTKIILIADGQKFPAYQCSIDCLGKPSNDEFRCCQNELTKDDPTDPTFYEAVHFGVSRSTFASLAKANSIQMQIGAGVFTIPSQTIAALRDFDDKLDTSNKQ